MEAGEPSVGPGAVPRIRIQGVRYGRSSSAAPSTRAARRPYASASNGSRSSQQRAAHRLVPKRALPCTPARNLRGDKPPLLLVVAHGGVLLQRRLELLLRGGCEEHRGKTAGDWAGAPMSIHRSACSPPPLGSESVRASKGASACALVLSAAARTCLNRVLWWLMAAATRFSTERALPHGASLVIGSTSRRRAARAGPPAAAAMHPCQYKRSRVSFESPGC